MVGAIHGRLLTAWSTAGVLGPMLVNYFHEYQLKVGTSREAVYNQTMYVLAGLLLVRAHLQSARRPCAEQYYMTDEEVAAEKKVTVAAVLEEDARSTPTSRILSRRGGSRRRRRGSAGRPRPMLGSKGGPLLLVLAWVAVGAPFAWGVWITLFNTVTLFC